jgi:hypothetical protein
VREKTPLLNVPGKRDSIDEVNVKAEGQGAEDQDTSGQMLPAVQGVSHCVDESSVLSQDQLSVHAQEGAVMSPPSADTDEQQPTPKAAVKSKSKPGNKSKATPKGAVKIKLVDDAGMTVASSTNGARSLPADPETTYDSTVNAGATTVGRGIDDGTAFVNTCDVSENPRQSPRIKLPTLDSKNLTADTNDASETGNRRPPDASGKAGPRLCLSSGLEADPTHGHTTRPSLHSIQSVKLQAKAKGKVVRNKTTHNKGETSPRNSPRYA